MGWRLEKTSDGRERGCDRSSAGCVKHVKTNAHTKKVTGRCAGDCYPCMPCANIGAKQREATRRQFDSTRDRGRARRPLERVDAAAPNGTRNSCLSVAASHRRHAVVNGLALRSVSAHARVCPNPLLRRKRTRTIRL